MFAYTVTCTFDDAAVADEWIAWLRDEHLRDVCEAGALDAQVARMDGEQEGKAIVQVRYHFADRDAFARYERDHAPRLREEGLKRFPLEQGLAYTRSTGEIVAQHP
jgi:hypothetical protein